MARQPLDYPVFDGQQQGYGRNRQPASHYYQGPMYDWQKQSLEGGLWKWLFGTDINPLESGEQFYTNPFYSRLGIGSPAGLMATTPSEGTMPQSFGRGLQSLMSPDYLKRMGGSSQYGGYGKSQLLSSWRDQIMDYMFRPETFLQSFQRMFPELSASFPPGARHEQEDIYKMLSMLLGGGV